MIICAYVVRRPVKVIYGVVKASDITMAWAEVRKLYPEDDLYVNPIEFNSGHVAEIHVEYYRSELSR